MQLEDPEIKDNPLKGLAEVMFQGLKPKIVPILSNEIYSAIAKQPESSDQNAREKQAADDMKEKLVLKILSSKALVLPLLMVIALLCLLHLTPKNLTKT